MIEIWGRRTSSNVQALLWCAQELGLTYQRHDAGHIYGVTDTDAFAQMKREGFTRPTTGFVPIHMPHSTATGVVLAALLIPGLWKLLGDART